MSVELQELGDVSSEVRVDRGGRQLLVSVEDDLDGMASIVAAYDPLIDRAVLIGLVVHLLEELERTHPDSYERVAEELREAPA